MLLRCVFLSLCLDFPDCHFNSTFIPTLTMLVTFATYTVIMKKELNGAFEDLHQKNRSDSNLVISLHNILQHSGF